MEYELENVALTLRETPYAYNTNLRQRDKGFKVLFEVKSQFIQLVKTFVKGDWVNELNEENIELADKELVLRFKVRKELQKYMPNFEYILIDVNNYTDEELTNTANLISSVFFLFHRMGKDDFYKEYRHTRMYRRKFLYKGGRRNDIRRLFTRYGNRND